MGHHHENDWSRFAGAEGADRVRRQHRERGERGGRRGGAGPWAEFADRGRGPGGMGRGGRSGPPPWLAGIFGMGQGPDERRGPRVRRGDVRSAILDVLRAAADSAEPVNGYQVIQQIAERSGGAWRPSPGSVYPTIQLLQDEGLVETDGERNRKSLALTADGTAYVAEHVAELAAVWAPFEREEREEAGSIGDVKAEIGRVMGAVWQIVTAGSAAQQRAAIGVLVDTRRTLYGILADGDEGLTDTDTGTGTDAETDGPADEAGAVNDAES